LRDLGNYIVATLISTAMGFCVGFLLSEARTKPEIIEVPCFVEVPEYEVVETQVVVEKEVVVEKPVEVVVEKMVYTHFYREYETLAEFTAWVEDNLVVLLPERTFDCDDYAENLQIEAYRDGYLLSCQVVDGGKLFGVTVSSDKRPHMGNLVMIDNDIFFVEPQPGIFRIVKIGYRDVK